MSGPPPGRRELAIAVVLFVATAASCVFSYAFFFGEGDVDARLSGPALRQGGVFAASLLTILLAHEMGHYLVARLHGFSVSLPWFVPFPNLFGTLGALIRLKSLPKSRAALLEMGAAGPLAGAAVAFVLLWISVRWSTPAGPLPEGATLLVFQDPLLVKLVGLVTTGAIPDPLATFHPVTMAAWVGCFVTGLNLLPIGQLDGGHVLNALSPRWAPRVSRVGPLLLVAGGLWWPGWFLAGALLFFLSVGRPLPVAAEPPLPLRARLVAACVAVVFVLTFLPAPIVETTIGRQP